MCALGLRHVREFPNGVNGLPFSVAVVELLERDRRSGLEQSTLGNEAGKTSSGERPPAETEDIDPIIQVVMLGEPLVGLDHFLIQPITEHAAFDVLPVLRADSDTVVGNLIGADGAERLHQQTFALSSAVFHVPSKNRAMRLGVSIIPRDAAFALIGQGVRNHAREKTCDSGGQLFYPALSRSCPTYGCYRRTDPNGFKVLAGTAREDLRKQSGHHRIVPVLGWTLIRERLSATAARRARLPDRTWRAEHERTRAGRAPRTKKPMWGRAWGRMGAHPNAAPFGGSPDPESGVISD